MSVFIYLLFRYLHFIFLKILVTVAKLLSRYEDGEFIKFHYSTVSNFGITNKIIIMENVTETSINKLVNSFYSSQEFRQSFNTKHVIQAVVKLIMVEI